MWYRPIFALVLHQKLRYFNFYYQYAQTFFTMFHVSENFERESNPLPLLQYLYLSGSAFLFSFTDPNKQFFNVKSMFKCLNMDLVCKKYIDLLLF